MLLLCKTTSVNHQLEVLGAHQLHNCVRGSKVAVGEVWQGECVTGTNWGQEGLGLSDSCEHQMYSSLPALNHPTQGR